MTYSHAGNLFDRTPWDTNEWVDDGYEFRPTNRRQTQAGMLEADVANNLAAQLANMTSMLQTLVLRNQGRPVAAMNAVHAMNSTASVTARSVVGDTCMTCVPTTSSLSAVLKTTPTTIWVGGTTLTSDGVGINNNRRRLSSSRREATLLVSTNGIKTNIISIRGIIRRTNQPHCLPWNLFYEKKTVKLKQRASCTKRCSRTKPLQFAI